MQIQRIESQWKSFAEAENPAAWQQFAWHPLIAPDNRGWFIACWGLCIRGGDSFRVKFEAIERAEKLLRDYLPIFKAALHDEERNAETKEQRDRIAGSISRLAFQQRMVQLHLSCLRVMGEHPFGTDSWSNGLQQLCSKEVPVGQVLDLEHELRHTPTGQTDKSVPTFAGPAWKETIGPLSGTVRPASYSVIMPVLLVNSSTKDGDPADLTLELVPRGRFKPKGTGDLYSAPALMLVERDEQFKAAETVACKLLSPLWPSDHDVRWRLAVRGDRKNSFLRLEGDSLRGAFELGLAKLFSLCQPEKVHARYPKLAKLRLEGVAVSAGLAPATATSKTEWGPVAGIEDLKKIVAAAGDTFPRIHTSVVSSQHDLPAASFKSQAPGFGVLGVRQAHNLGEAIEELSSAATVFWQGLEPVLPEPPEECEIPREMLLKRIEDIVEANDSGFIEITGEAGRGKSVAMKQLVRAREKAGRDPIFWFIGVGGNHSTEGARIIRSLHRQLCRKYRFKEDDEQWHEMPDDRKLAELMNKISTQLKAAKQKEVIFLDAADQLTSGQKGKLVPDLLNRLPPGFFCVISTLPDKTAWRGSPIQMLAEEDFSNLVDDKKDCLALLDRRGAGFLDEEFRRRIVEVTPPNPLPMMFTIDSHLRKLEKPIEGEEELRKSLAKNVEPWRELPETRVKHDLEWVVDCCWQQHRIAHERALFILGVHTCVGRDITRSELEALNKAAGTKLGKDKLWDEDTEKVLRQSANLFKGSPVDNPTEPLRFRNDIYKRVLKNLVIQLPADESEAEKAKESET